jgi:hypothetical protein
MYVKAAVIQLYIQSIHVTICQLQRILSAQSVVLMAEEGADASLSLYKGIPLTRSTPYRISLSPVIGILILSISSIWPCMLQVNYQSTAKDMLQSVTVVVLL